MIVTSALPVATAAAPTAARDVDGRAVDTRDAGDTTVQTPAPSADGKAPVDASDAAPGAMDTVMAAAAADTTDFSAVIATTSAPVRAIPLMAQPTTPMQIGAHAPQGPGLGGAFLALVLVLGLILGLAWLLKRLPGSGFRQADGLRVVASISLGAKERAAVVQVGGEQLLLGIGAGGVRTLHVLPQPLPEAAPAQMPTLKNLPDFKQLLAQRLRKDT